MSKNIYSFLIFFSFCQLMYGQSEAETLYKQAEDLYNGTNGKFMNRDKALQLYIEAGEANYIPAQKKLIDIYLDGIIVDKDTSKIVYWTRKGAELKDAGLQNKMGIYYAEGKYLKKDLEQSLYWFNLAASQGYIPSMNNLGIVYSWTKDSIQSLEWYRKAAENNYSDAQLALADLYLEGKYVRQDSEQGVYWMKKASDNGNAKAQNRLGVMCHFGRNVPKDYAQAFKLYLSAAENGSDDALGNIARAYANGWGVDTDYHKAVEYYEMSIKEGDISSYYELGMLLYEGNDVIQKNRERGLELLRLAAKNGNKDAKAYLEKIVSGVVEKDVKNLQEGGKKKKTKKSFSLNGMEIWHN